MHAFFKIITCSPEIKMCESFQNSILESNWTTFTRMRSLLFFSQLGKRNLSIQEFFFLFFQHILFPLLIRMSNLITIKYITKSNHLNTRTHPPIKSRIYTTDISCVMTRPSTFVERIVSCLDMWPIICLIPQRSKTNFPSFHPNLFLLFCDKGLTVLQSGVPYFQRNWLCQIILFVSK